MSWSSVTPHLESGGFARIETIGQTESTVPENMKEARKSHERPPISAHEDFRRKKTLNGKEQRQAEKGREYKLGHQVGPTKSRYELGTTAVQK